MHWYLRYPGLELRHQLRAITARVNEARKIAHAFGETARPYLPIVSTVVNAEFRRDTRHAHQAVVKQMSLDVEVVQPVGRIGIMILVITDSDEQ